MGTKNDPYFDSEYNGSDMDRAWSAALNPDAEPRAGSDALITSGAVAAVAAAASGTRADLDALSAAAARWTSIADVERG